ncbi:D-alanine--D-alanine ligase [Candidatus Shapirobacteria bacterium CG06_land_8_20_14_3_00_40_12]|uniref:D-alanine--D-alanine ligase n=2 Tax=Candidatus Shapironibacteriota TaxID=1752721 RepID=A0A2M7TSQ8_9BACT|nr:MAG: D-alanine--D-alanine ligase [Candidatus Shapirobacteria bacterium CG06_land_8_20_14_3_00_40_12]PIZ58839.1 MAG: D-alanine--D-alanine ligase [Candidatus Shapirobacteria bacterium CG_4_10_14_0_2_um_filter_40_12]
MKTRVAVVFGSRSVEHEVSVVTAAQVFSSINKNKYEVIPVYIDKEGKWWSGSKLADLKSFKNLQLKSELGLRQYRLSGIWGEKKLVSVDGWPKKEIIFDIAFLAIHGTFGEDGTIQGMLEMLNIPYTGSGVTASAVGMDKVIQKALFEKEGISVVKYVWFNKSEWENNKKEKIKEVEEKLGYPAFVKPANLGSSVGINVAKNRKELEWAVSVAMEFDRKILVEEGKLGIDEINVSVMGNEKIEVSICEQPIKGNKLLTYEDKYLKGGKIKGMASLSRLVPAPISIKLKEMIQEMALKGFRAVGAGGLARIDFLVDIKEGKVWLNEINTLPGSLSFYLWEKSGYPFSRLIDRLVELGIERWQLRQKIQFSFDSKLLQK